MKKRMLSLFLATLIIVSVLNLPALATDVDSSIPESSAIDEVILELDASSDTASVSEETPVTTEAPTQEGSEENLENNQIKPADEVYSQDLDIQDDTQPDTEASASTYTATDSSESDPVMYTLSYSAGNITSQEAASGTVIYVSTTKPSKAKFTFLGWSTEVNAVSVEYYAGDPILLTEDTVLYPVYRPNAPAASLLLQKTLVEHCNDSGEELRTAMATTVGGTKFWSSDVCNRSAVSLGSDGKYHWSITFDKQAWINTSFCRTHRSHEIVGSDAYITLTYTWDGTAWQCDSTQDVYTIELQCKDISYIWYDDLHGNELFRSDAMKSCNAVEPTYAGEIPTKTAENYVYTFKGWNQDTDANGNVIFNALYNRTPIEATANWTINGQVYDTKYVNIDATDGELTELSTIPDPEQIPEGYVFAGWGNPIRRGTVITIDALLTPAKPSAAFLSGLTLEIGCDTHTLSCALAQPADGGFTYWDAAYTNAAFAEVTANADGSYSWTMEVYPSAWVAAFNAAHQPALGYAHTGSGLPSSINVTCKWDPQTQKWACSQDTISIQVLGPEVTYQWLDGESDEPLKTVTQSICLAAPEAPEAPSKDSEYVSFTFTGWNTATDENGNVTYTAQYTPTRKTVSVYWVVNGIVVKSVDNVDKQVRDDDLAALAPAGDPEVDGYTFDGWNDPQRSDDTIIITAKLTEVVPETPDTPDTPDTPNTPATPDAPGTTDTPSTPVTPDTPDTPDAPTNPGTTATPTTPNAPANPAAPVTTPAANTQAAPNVAADPTIANTEDDTEANAAVDTEVAAEVEDGLDVVAENEVPLAELPDIMAGNPAEQDLINIDGDAVPLSAPEVAPQEASTSLPVIILLAVLVLLIAALAVIYVIRKKSANQAKKDTV